MSKNTKTILIVSLITLLVIGLAILIFYLVYQSNSNNTNNDDLNNNTNENNNSNSSINVYDPENLTSTNYEDKTVTIYLFKGRGCPHCEHATEFLETIISEYPYLEVKTYEVWYNDENYELMQEVLSELNLEISKSVPLIVIGDNYYLRGYSSSRDEEIKTAIENAFRDNNYNDFIEDILYNNDINVNEETID